MTIVYLLGVILTCIMIWKASDYFEMATEWIGRNLTDGVKGASLNAIASSMPEVLTGFIFLFYLHGSDGYSGTIGTTAGSAVFNSLIIPGLVILLVTMFMGIGYITISKKVAKRDGLFLLLSELILIFVISSNTITWKEGFLLVALYAIYLIIMFRGMRKNVDPFAPQEEESEEEYSVTGRKAWVYLIISTLIMTLACWLLVHCVDQIGQAMNIPLIFVSIILAAAASSVPDTVISLRDARKGNYNDAVSNALGSNIFDICIAHGLPLFIYTILYGPIVMTDSTTDHSVELRVWLFILTAITVLIYLFTKKLNKVSGFLMILLYGVFIVFVIGRSLDIEIFNQFGNILNIQHLWES